MRLTGDQKIVIAFLDAGYLLFCSKKTDRPYTAWEYEIAESKRHRTVFRPHYRTIEALVNKGIINPKTLELTEK